MKNVAAPILAFLLVAFSFSKISAATGKDPIIIEVITNYTDINDALQAAKTALLKEKFIVTDGLQKTGFTATRTTGAKADYYVADVSAKDEQGKIRITISFIKMGTGLLKLQKTADTVKADLEK